ncbi:MAG: acylphosphatase [Methylococcaceae bacterium]|nr:acylphosphatase [Methylococcaceae bacterium]
MKTVQIIVSGRVQGVCYRASTQKIAKAHNIQGWVKNLPDGCVEIRACAEAQQLEHLISWCHAGPIFARVDGVTVTDVDTVDLAPGFIII